MFGDWPQRGIHEKSPQTWVTKASAPIPFEHEDVSDLIGIGSQAGQRVVILSTCWRNIRPHAHFRSFLNHSSKDATRSSWHLGTKSIMKIYRIATRNKCIATSNKCLTSSNNKNLFRIVISIKGIYIELLLENLCRNGLAASTTR